MTPVHDRFELERERKKLTARLIKINALLDNLDDEPDRPETYHEYKKRTGEQ